MAKFTNQAEKAQNKAERIASPKLIKKLSGKTVKEIKELYGLRDRTAKYLKLPALTTEDKLSKLSIDLQQIVNNNTDTANRDKLIDTLYKKTTRVKMSYKNYLIQSISKHKKNILTEREYYERERETTTTSSKIDTLNEIMSAYENIINKVPNAKSVNITDFYKLVSKMTTKQFNQALNEINSLVRNRTITEYISSLSDSVENTLNDDNEKRKQHNIRDTIYATADKTASLMQSFYGILLNASENLYEDKVEKMEDTPENRQKGREEFEERQRKKAENERIANEIFGDFDEDMFN